MRARILTAVIALFASPALAHPISLNIDQSKPMVFKSPATGVVVGNASIADVIVHDNKTIIVMGKSVGSTHVLILGENGRTLYSGMISVSAGNSANLLSVQRGAEIETKLCANRCIDVVSPEDSTAKLNEAVGKIRSRASVTTSGH